MNKKEAISDLNKKLAERVRVLEKFTKGQKEIIDRQAEYIDCLEDLIDRENNIRVLPNGRRNLVLLQ